MAQGYSILRFGPFWEVVAIDNGRKHIVVDTYPRLQGELPVEVFGPASKGECMRWAHTTALLYLTVKGSLIGDS